MSLKFDIVVIGGGHAGIEAANVAAKLNKSVALITFSEKHIGKLSCNPAIGGIAKSHVVREVDCLGGLMGIVADRTALQYRVLNRSKGYAVRATRTQNDRTLYPTVVQGLLKENENICIIEAEVEMINIETGRVKEVALENGMKISTMAVIVATGTFLGAKIFIGQDTILEGRAGESSSTVLAESLKSQGFTMLRFKTGTPPRIYADSIDYSKTNRQNGEREYRPLSITTETKLPEADQMPCYLTRTNEETHEIIHENIHLSPMFDDRIEGTGPRYCPSIEVKLVRFPNNPSHTIFLEPEGRNSNEIYANGISMSLPREVQEKALKKIKGLENCRVSQWAYAVEYDCIDPRQLNNTLEHSEIEGLFFAGQINGTSGYEEAAGQGIIAGINAALKIDEKPPFILKRDESYIAVMIDDIVSFGTDEPYRLFSSRAEYRLRLREDNAVFRMLDHAEEYRLLPNNILDKYRKLEEAFKNEFLRMQTDRIPSELHNRVSSPNKPTGYNFLKQQGNSFKELIDSGYCSPDIPEDIAESIEIEVKYEGFIVREEKRAQSYNRISSISLACDIDYSTIDGLTAEAAEKLAKFRPPTLGDAGNIPGITQAAIFAIYVYINRKNNVSHETTP